MQRVRWIHLRRELINWLSKGVSALLGSSGAVKGVTDVANKGMEMWDNSNFTPQERVAAFERLAKVMGSKETALSRRILLWAILMLNGFSFIVGVIWMALGWGDKVDGLIALVEAFKLGWAFTAAVGFYYLAHIVNGGKK